MKIKKWKKLLTCAVSLSVLAAAVTACTTGKNADYSSIAEHEQKLSQARTEMFVIKGDDESISRDFSIVSAVDYLREGKKLYYLMIVPSSTSNPEIRNLELQADYPYIIHGKDIDDLLVNIDKIAGEWDSTEQRYSGAVYNFYISSPQDSRPWLEEKTSWYQEKKFYEVTPYIKFNYIKNERKAKAKLAVGSRIDQIIYITTDGKTSKSRVFFKEDEKSWGFDTSAEIRDFQTLLAKGLRDLKDKGMDGYYRKSEPKAEVKPEVKQEIIPEVKTEVIPAEKKVQKKKTRRKKSSN